MSEQEKKRIYDWLNAETEPKFFVCRIQSKENSFTEKELFKEKGEKKIENPPPKKNKKQQQKNKKKNKKKKRKEGFLIALATAIKKDSTMSITKHVNKLKVHKKTVRTAIK